MITIESLIAEIKKDTLFQLAQQSVSESERTMVETETIKLFRSMIEPMLPLLNAIHESPESRAQIQKELVKMFNGRDLVK